jgi:hypothetical protein
MTKQNKHPINPITVQCVSKDTAREKRSRRTNLRYAANPIGEHATHKVEDREKSCPHSSQDDHDERSVS